MCCPGASRCCPEGLQGGEPRRCPGMLPGAALGAPRCCPLGAPRCCTGVSLGAALGATGALTGGAAKSQQMLPGAVTHSRGAIVRLLMVTSGVAMNSHGMWRSRAL
eukprot:353371-Chlamydomonas_euryale.AAC.4